MRTKMPLPAVHPLAWRFGAAAALLLATLGATTLSAERTRFWRQSQFEDFEKGTAKGLALRSDGTIVLAPRFTLFSDAHLPHLWALATDSRGNLYAAGGSNAKVLRLDTSGNMTTVFESSEITARALLVDRNDNLYVATSPDGRIYRITAGGQRSVFFEPGTKYIWDLAMGPDGTLYVATGDTGKIFAISPDGRGELFYSADEVHIRSLALDGQGHLLAGTEPNGRVLRVPLATPADGASRSAYVVYETPKREITALVLDAAGNLYVAAIGEKASPGAAPPAPQPQQPAQQQSAAAGVTVTVTATAPGAQQQQPQQQVPVAVTPLPRLVSSSVYRITADGSPEEIWTARQDIVYSMSLASDGSLLLGIGNSGAVLQLTADRVFSRLATTASEQVTGFARAPGGRVYVATANPGKVFALGPELEAEGSFESQPFDARIFSRWGRLSWWGQNTSSPTPGVELYVRAGNTSDPANNWSPWSGPYRDPRTAVVEAPSARFVQWKAVLRAGADATLDLSSVSLAYLPKNVAPRITAVVLQDPGVRIASSGPQGGAQQSVPVPLRQPTAPSLQSGGVSVQRPQAPPRFEPQPQGFAQKGFQGVLWSAEDDNDDELTYAIYYRGEGEKDWKLLRDKLDQKFYSWDTSSMADGAYYLKIVASDERSNPPGEFLTAERQSERFVVDNQPPEVTGLVAQPAASGVTLRFRASDATSPVVRAEYSLDAADWTLAPPEDGLSDSAEETYAPVLRDVSPGEHTVAVRVYDQFDNVGTGKVTFTLPPAAR